MKITIQYRVKVQPPSRAGALDAQYIIEKRPAIRLFGKVISRSKWSFHDTALSVDSAKQKISDHKLLMYRESNPLIVYSE